MSKVFTEGCQSCRFGQQHLQLSTVLRQRESRRQPRCPALDVSRFAEVSPSKACVESAIRDQLCLKNQLGAIFSCKFLIISLANSAVLVKVGP